MSSNTRFIVMQQSSAEQSDPVPMSPPRGSTVVYEDPASDGSDWVSP